MRNEGFVKTVYSPDCLCSLLTVYCVVVAQPIALKAIIYMARSFSLAHFHNDSTRRLNGWFTLLINCSCTLERFLQCTSRGRDSWRKNTFRSFYATFWRRCSRQQWDVGYAFIGGTSKRQKPNLFASESRSLDALKTFAAKNETSCL